MMKNGTAVEDDLARTQDADCVVPGGNGHAGTDSELAGHVDGVVIVCIVVARIDCAIRSRDREVAGRGNVDEGHILVVAIEVAADALPRSVWLQRAAGPAQRLGLLFGDEVPRQMAVKMQIERDVVPGGIASVLRQRWLRPRAR